jgi:hypothetical protein
MHDAVLTVDEADALLVEQMRLALATVRHLATEGQIPLRDVPVLERDHGALVEGSPATQPEWQTFFPMLTRVDGFWEQMAEVAQRLRGAELIEDLLGWAPATEQRAPALWSDVIAPLVHVYLLRRADGEWDEAESRRVVQLWRRSAMPNEIEFQVIAPLHNLAQWGGPVEVEDGFMIRELTDDERWDLWQTFGGRQNPSQIAPTVQDLERWSAVIDLRWKRPPSPPLTGEAVAEITNRLEQLVTAQRLHHIGIVGITVVWVRPMPPELAIFGPDRLMLFARELSTGFEDPLVSQIGPGDGEPLRELLGKISAVSDKKLSLALRRFNSSYARQDVADVLIDLWVAVEALLLPDGNQELSYRAALRLARATGTDEPSRRAAFDQARESYKVRSKVVHGDDVADEKVTATVRETRELVRQALRKWLLDPPPEGATSLDYELLT